MSSRDAVLPVNRFGCAEPTVWLWAVLLYAVSHPLYLMPVIRQMLGPWSELLANPGYLVGDALVFVLLYTWFNRIPESGTGFRWIWRQGRWLLLGSYVWSLAVLLWANQAVFVRADHRHFAAAMVLAVINVAAIVYLWRAHSVRQVFAEFPEPVNADQARETAAAKAQKRKQFELEARLAAPIGRGAETKAQEAHWRAEIERHPGQAAPWLELGVLAYQCGQADQALALMEEARRCESDNATVLRNLCELYRQQKLLARAVDLGERAVELAPSDIVARLNLAQVLVDKQQPALAIAQYHRVIEIDPHHVQTWLNLAVLLQQQGRMADAQAALDAVLLIEPGHEQALTLKKHLH